MEKPHVEHIEGLSPAVAVEQKNMGQTPRSTVGTVTEIYDYLRVLYARLGTPYCPACQTPIGSQTVDEIVDKIMAEPSGTKLYILAPVSIHVGESYETLWDEMRASGYARIRVDGVTYLLDDAPAIDRRRKHELQIVIDRVTVQESSRSRIAESAEAALSLGGGTLSVAYPRDGVSEERWATRIHSQHFVCDRCSRSFEPLTPHHFSFNSPLGWCASCEGLGTGTGADPAALLRDPKLSLSEGAIALWPDVSKPLAKAMLAALCKQQNIPADVPFADLPVKERRLIYYGTGDEWIDVLPPSSRKRNPRPLFRFQYKGLYPALAEAARLSPNLRTKLAYLVAEVECGTCAGSRLRDDAAAVRLHGDTIDDLCRMPLAKFAETVDGWKFSDREKKVAGELVREISNRTRFLLDVGLDYLTVARPAASLSGGEAQRIRLASQVGSGLCGVLYVLDEPTIGLHPRDNSRLVRALERLRDLGNTLLVVEHDREVVASADQLLDFGPRAGEFGGEIVARGTPKQVAGARGSVTGPYLSGKKSIAIPSNRRMPSASGGGTKTKKQGSPPGGAWLEVIGARHNNLRNINAAIPLGTLTAVTGVSGSGKSSLVEDVLYRALAQRLHRANVSPAPHDEIRGLEHINKVIRVDQQPLGNSPTSNPATYTGLFDLVRSLFAQLPEAKLRGYSPRRFSFNVPGGRCESCEGNGQLCVEMHFLPDVWVECDECRGKRYNPETLGVLFHGYSIADVLDMSCGKAVELFKNIPKIRRILQMLCDVGLDYVKLGQAAPTLSGGEAQRVKLAAELARPDTGQTLYLLDEPTTGLHFDDLAKLLDVLNRLVDMRNTVVVIEHNTDVIKTADWIIDIGPEAGAAGGRVVAAGTPEDIVEYAAKKAKGREQLHSYTGEILKDVLANGTRAKRKLYDAAATEQTGEEDLEISEVGKAVKMPWEVDGRGWHTKDRVARNGQSCKWDGRIVSRVVDNLEERKRFADANWAARTVVEITGEKKTDGWFLHALTGDQWLVTLKFRVARNTFKQGELVERLKLEPLNELDHLPIYGNEPRVKCKNLRGPWQEVQLRIAALAEIEQPEFWKFLDECVAAFEKITRRKELKPGDIMPWTVLGEKWHLARKGFPPGKPAKWDVAVLEKLCKLLSTTAKDSQFDWKNQQVVHVYVAKQPEPWATIYTKRPASIELLLSGPKNRVALGRVAELGAERDVVAGRKQRDVVKLKFHAAHDLTRGDLPEFLAEHLASVRSEANGEV
jgi:excinuclease ABC subunit A